MVNGRGSLGDVALGLVVGGVALGVATAPAADTGTLAVLALGTTAGSRYNLLELGGWMLGGAALLGAVGWGLASVLATPVEPTVGLGAGIAVGGGMGAVVRLLEFGDTEPVAPEEMTVSTESTADASPQPLDLFEASPDPLLYFDATGEGPVVRAANPAFEDVFGVGADAVTGAGLADALMVTERDERILAAATDGEPFDAELSCEIHEGETTLRVRVVSVAEDGVARGYVQYVS